MKTILLVGTLLGCTALSFGQSPSGEVNGFGLSFKPDFVFKGSDLSGWRAVGGVDWRAENGEMIGTVKPGATNGFLVSSKAYQDVGVHALFKCPAETEAGILLRLETTGEGMRGVLISVKNGAVDSYNITFDAQGRELNREYLRSAGQDALVRIAPSGGTNAPARRSGGNRNRNQRPSDANLPLARPNTSFRPGEWNQIEIMLDVNIIRSFLNDGGPAGMGATDDNGANYGPVALYVNGAGEVRFKEIMCKDVSLMFTPKEASAPRFQAQRISDMYYSWGVAAGDFNRDGNMDIAAGPYIYFGPEFTTYREIFPATTFSPSRAFTDVNCQYVFDFNGDGWLDILTGPPRATLYLNPKGESRRWQKYVVVQSVQSEVTVFKDIDGSGVPALIYGSAGTVRYAKPDPSDPTKPWIEHVISEKGYAMAHGIGAGDINGDGRIDILNPNGWWEQPAAGSTQDLWKYHPEAFARYGHRGTGVGGAVMGVYDVNGDHLNDVVTGLNAHGFGLAWFEQKRDADGTIHFVRHMISDDYASKNAGDVTFSEPHGATFADIDNDGVLDFIVGKRYWSHLDSYLDPDPYSAPVLYWYRTVRNPNAPGGAEFVPELIHNRSGVGSDVLAVDLNKDGAVDVITSTDRGTFIFWNMGKKLHLMP